MSKSFGQYVEELRKTRNLSQRELAHFSGVSNSTISRIEVGTVDPDTATLRALARGLDIDFTTLCKKSMVWTNSEQTVAGYDEIISVISTFEFETVHQWPDAPENVSYLREIHRHVFKCRIEMEVSHDDRDIEFITVKNDLQLWVAGKVVDWPLTISCEQIAKKLIGYCFNKYGYRNISCTVMEDGENGATVKWVEESK